MADVNDQKVLSERLLEWEINNYKLIDPKMCINGSDIRTLKADGVNKISTRIRQVGYSTSNCIVVMKHPEEDGIYLVIDGWHRVNAFEI